MRSEALSPDIQEEFRSLYLSNMVKLDSLNKLIKANLLSQDVLDEWIVERYEMFGEVSLQDKIDSLENLDEIKDSIKEKEKENNKDKKPGQDNKPNG